MISQTNHWRLIDTGPLSGAENMAIDEALLACFTPERDLPILRLYGWSPPAFSCGRFQQPEEIIDLKSCRSDGVQVVKRITGGGVIYHADELTYSLVCSTRLIPAGNSVKDAFFFLTSFLLTFYRNLGLIPRYGAQHPPSDLRLGERTPLCFAGVEHCDILINGRKIGGNAQKRLKNVIFQHGSIPLVQMADRGDSYLLQPDPGILNRTTSLQNEQVFQNRDDLAEQFSAAFALTFHAFLKKGALSTAEEQCCSRYMQKTE